jgi:cardiolipin synthase
MRPVSCLLLALALLAGVARAQVITAAPDPNHGILSAATQSWADTLAGSPLTANNQHVLLENGVRSLPEKLALCAGAQQQLFFSTMVAMHDTSGGQLCDAMIAAAARGVRVRAILDGQRSDPRVWRALRQGGVQVALFNPWFDLGGRKHRFHQKVLIADLRTMIAGGMNATDSYLLGDGVNSNYKDTDVRVAGDAAAAASLGFLRQWLALEPNDQDARALLASGSTWGPLAVAGGPTARAGHARWLVQESDRGETTIRDYYQRCFEESRGQVLWHVNNLIPTSTLTTALTDAAGRGVRVVIVTNSARANARRNGAIAGWFQTQYLRLQMRRLRNTGIQVWEIDVPIHSKALTVDGVMASVGSYNYSSSSENNLESTCVSYDPALITEVEAMFERDLRGGRRVQ